MLSKLSEARLDEKTQKTCKTVHFLCIDLTVEVKDDVFSKKLVMT